MKILIVNPIIYTSETKNISRAKSIKDTMIYDLCLAFLQNGDEVTLATAEDFKPTQTEEYPFEVIWMKTRLKSICPVNSLPYCPEIKRIAKSTAFDCIITSEVFSLNSLMLSMHSRKNLIVWHELGKHNKIFHGIASRFWYGVIARLCFKNTLIVSRSPQAKKFISQYCRNVSDIIIDHGVNLDKFTFTADKGNYFAVSSQLIKRKRIDKILAAFADYLKKYDTTAKLYIMGDGDEKQNLENEVKRLNICDSVIFTGRLMHNELEKRLAHAMAMLVYTEKDNNMISIVESIAVGTPVLTTTVPYNASYITEYGLGIADDNWNCDTLKEITDKKYIEACEKYREKISTKSKVELFYKAFDELKQYEQF